MKKTTENRYPHSANLFKFCKEALELRYDGHLKVIDQDVGAILAFDPADCSHWKKGKKNVKSLLNLKAIANHLNVDDRLLIDITSGKIDSEEAIFEFKYFKDLDANGQKMEDFKKDFFKNPAKWQQTNVHTFNSFEDFFKHNKTSILRCVNKILTLGHFEEAPIYIPEVYKLFPEVKLEHLETKESDLSSSDVLEEKEKLKKQASPVVSTLSSEDPTKRVVTYTGIMKPYIRFLLAKELFINLVQMHHPLVEDFDFEPEEMLKIYAKIFALNLLIPGKALQKEMLRIKHSFDPIEQLADLFWVSKTMINKRLSDYCSGDVF